MTMEDYTCEHSDITQNNGYSVCRECGLTFDGNLVFEKHTPRAFLSESHQDYERKIKSISSRAKQDPKVALKFKKLKTLETWFRDYRTSFTQQKKTIALLNNFGFSINQIASEEIKKQYIRYTKNQRKTYENMVINFLAIVWLEIKDTTNKRLEEYIKACNELGHKISKKMMSKAIQRVISYKQKKISSLDKIEERIKDRIKILLQKDLNNIPFEEHPEIIDGKAEYEQLKMLVLRLGNSLLERLSYKHLQNLNYKAFTSGFIYYIGQCLSKQKRRLFVQTTIEKATSFSSTTIRKKFNGLKTVLGLPELYRTQIA